MCAAMADMISHLCSHPFLRRRLVMSSYTLCNTIIVNQFSSATECQIALQKKPPFLSPYKALNVLRIQTDPHKLVEVFNQSSQQPGFNHLREAYKVTVRKLAVAKEFDAIQQILEHLIEVSQPCTEGLLIRIIMLYGSAGMPQQAVQTFHKIEVPTLKSFNAILTALVEAKSPKMACDLYSDINSFGISADLQTYNIVVKAICEMGRPESASLFLDRMSKCGFQPNIITYNTILGGFYKQGNYKEADELLLKMSERCPPDVTTYNIRMGKLCKDRRTNEARKLVNEMVSKGLTPDVISFNLLITGFCRENNLKEAKRVFFDMSGNGCEPNNLSYYTLIYFLCKEGDFDMAFELCDQILSKNWIPNTATTKMLVNGLIKNGRVDDAAKIINGMKKRFPLSCLGTWDSIGTGDYERNKIHGQQICPLDA